MNNTKMIKRVEKEDIRVLAELATWMWTIHTKIEYEEM